MWWGGGRGVKAKVIESAGKDFACFRQYLKKGVFLVTAAFSSSLLPAASGATHSVDVVQQRCLVGCVVLQQRHGNGFQQQTQGHGHAPVQQAEEQGHDQLMG